MSAVLELEQATAEQKTNSVLSDAVKPHLISAAMYDKMIEHGILTENDKVELLNGVIIEKMPKGAKHTAATSRVNRVFSSLFGNRSIIRIQDPILLDNLSEPEPDVVLAALNENEYEGGHPTPEHIFLILEVSDTTISTDRNSKQQAYSRAGIRQYLLLNVQNSTLEDYREPSADGYQFKQTYRAGQTFTLVAFPEVEINVSEFLPKLQ
jgi:Uma2 family endonuclease